MLQTYELIQDSETYDDCEEQKEDEHDDQMGRKTRDLL